MDDKKYVSLNSLKIFLNNLIVMMNTHNTTTDSHNDIRIEIEDIAARLSALADCDDETLDQISEIVQYIKDNRELIEQITTAKINVNDIIDNLDTNVSNKPLSAAQGVVLNQLLTYVTEDVENIKSTYVPLSSRGIVNGVAPLNGNKKIDSQYLPVYTEINVTPSDSIADLSAKQTWTSEQTYNFEDYGLVLEDVINGIACGFKAPRGLFNQLFVEDIVFTRADKTATSGMADEIGFYVWNGVESKSAVRDANGNITTEGYNNLLEYEKVAAITKDGGLILKSSTPNSSKYFKITVDDNGKISAIQV